MGWWRREEAPPAEQAGERDPAAAARTRRVAGRPALGRRGEKLAEKYLKKRGYKRMARNLRNHFGEIDLLMRAPREAGEARWERRAVVVVEVKSGTRNDKYRPEDHVNRTKQAKLVKLAAQVVRRYRLQDERIRFDVVAVEFAGPEDEAPEIRHYVGAFRSGGVRWRGGLFAPRARNPPVTSRMAAVVGQGLPCRRPGGPNKS